ncbi:MAG: STAS domain-containing protein [Candidatus Krumholzibacteriia bacterium]
MFEIKDIGDGTISLSGRFDAAQTEKARAVLNQANGSLVIDFGELDYISSAGLGVLLGAQKRLGESGGRLRLVNMNQHIREIFHIAGFDRIFEIE